MGDAGAFVALFMKLRETAGRDRNTARLTIGKQWGRL